MTIWSGCTQDLNQADISVLRKAELKDRLAKSRKAFDDENKAREKAASKAVGPLLDLAGGVDIWWQATDDVTKFFKENPNAPLYVKLFEVGGNTKVCCIFYFGQVIKSLLSMVDRSFKMLPRMRSHWENRFIPSVLISKRTRSFMWTTSQNHWFQRPSMRAFGQTRFLPC